MAIDPEGRIASANAEAAHLFGWTVKELVGSKIESVIPEQLELGELLERTQNGRSMTKQLGAAQDLLARRQDGSEFPAQISFGGFATGQGDFLAAVIRDASELRTVERRFRDVLESAPDAMVGVDVDGLIELVNSQAERLFGWSAAELIGRNIEMLVPEAMLDRHVESWSTYLADLHPRPFGVGSQLAGRRRDGTTFPAEMSLSAVGGDQGRLVLAAVRDVTERLGLEADRQQVALENQREQSDRLESLGSLAGGVAHDFNNLLGVILNYTALLEKRITDPVPVADLGEIRAAAQRGAALTRQLLAFARREEANVESLEVNAVIRGVGSMLGRTIGEGIDLRLELTDGPAFALADRNQLEQIVLNLVINARDAMPTGGRLAIRSAVDADDGQVKIQVADTGEGMAEEVAARAFEPFFTTKPTGEGTGLGLATVYGIVRQSGGEVSIDTAVGVGTTVTVLLPAAPVRALTVQGALGPLVGGHERILLVEDESVLRVGTARIITEHGYEVLTAGDGVEALEILAREKGRIALVLSDVAMPRMRGDELGRRIAEEYPEVRVLFVSGYMSGSTPLVGRVLPKPVSQVVLLGAIREALDA